MALFVVVVLYYQHHDRKSIFFAQRSEDFFTGSELTAGRWKDYAHGNRVKTMTLPAEEFLRRFLLHVLPGGFVRIRHFGFLANRGRTAKLARCRELLTAGPSEAPPAVEPFG